MARVRGLRKAGPSIVAPIVTPRNMVATSMITPPAARESRSVTPDSRSRFPNISMPTSGPQEGTARAATTAVTMGKTTRAVFDTGFAWGMSMALSARVVSRRRIGGWRIGTSDM